MILGFYVIKGGGTKYTHPFPRQGMAALFAVQVMGLLGSPSAVAMVVEHKNVEDTSWTTAGTISDISGAVQSTIDISALKELIRYAFTVTATNDWEGVYTQPMAPAWRPY